MIKPKAINCNSQLVAFVLLICKTLIGAQIRKNRIWRNRIWRNRSCSEMSKLEMKSDEQPMNEMLRPEQIRHWLFFFGSIQWMVAEKQREPDAEIVGQDQSSGFC